MARGHALVAEADARIAACGAEEDEAGGMGDDARVRRILEEANDETAAYLKRETDKLLDKVLLTSSLLMRNGFSLSDH